MIPRTIPSWQIKSWQQELSELITQPCELFSLLELDPTLLPAAERAHSLFPLRATHAYVSRIAKSLPSDPLLRQILPLDLEFQNNEAFSLDPLEEASSSPAPGLIHKYPGRVLLIASTQCAINCRYCFRRHFDYQNHALARPQWQQALTYIAQNTSIHEVILSGGDPLALADKQLLWLTQQLAEIPHVKTLRIHSRLPIVAPSRIDGAFIEALCSTRLQCIMVIHCNHANEIDEHVADALRHLRQAMPVLNQSVLLKDINDDVKLLMALSHKLFSCGVLPYYLHALDKVSGATHFAVSEERALSLHAAMVKGLSGYLVPKLVKEVPNALSKIALC